MKVLLVNGSPHEKGCTYTALTEVAKILNAEGIETEIFHIGSAPISGCRGCGACKKQKLGKCVVDDIVNVFAAKAKEADGFVFGSPVHYASMGGSLAAFMDRLFYSSGKDTMRLKPAAAVASARRAGTTATLDIINKYRDKAHLPYLLPICKSLNDTHQTYRMAMARVNKYLKQVGRLADIDAPLTMYVARHSWASVARDQRIPLSIISHGMGHDSEHTTQIYLASISSTLIDNANTRILSHLTTLNASSPCRNS